MKESEKKTNEVRSMFVAVKRGGRGDVESNVSRKGSIDQRPQWTVANVVFLVLNRSLNP